MAADDDLAINHPFYNYTMQDPHAREREGHSIFYKDASGAVFHTYSCYHRGNDKLNLHCHYLDLVPKDATREGAGPSGYGVAMSTVASGYALVPPRL